MAASTFFIPSVNVIGADSLKDAMNTMAEYGFRRTLIVTDAMLTKLGMAGEIQKALQERDIFSVIYDGTHPKEGANKQVISSQADSLIKISRIWADFFPA
uniref:iron-containing alcohol dehydrogenase n=1 Tax=Citrobacter freundii TaxID=546 RepID=UPI003978EE7A